MSNQKRNYLISLNVLVAVFSVMNTNAYADSTGSYHHGDNWGMMFGSPMMIIAIALIGFLIILVVRRLSDKSLPRNGTTSALEVLRQRYARGEIDKQEFEERSATLTSND